MTKLIPITPAAQLVASASSRASRRDILVSIGFSGLAAVSAAGFVMPESSETARSASTSQDAELLAMIGEFNSIEGRIEATCAGRAIEAAREDYDFGCPEEVEEDAKLDALYAKQRTVFMQIKSTRALTVDGLRARGLMLEAWDTDLADEGTPGGFYRAQMISALLRDLATLSA